MKTRTPFPALSVLVCAAAVVLGLARPWCDGFLLLQREGPVSSWLPALWTTHLLHASPGHLVLNAAAALLALGWLEQNNRRALVACLALGSPVIALATLLSMPGLTDYCGLSGVLHAVLGCLCVQGLFERRRLLPALGLLCLFAKLLLEWRHPGSLFVADLPPGHVATPIAHAAGLAVGLLVGLAAPPRRSAVARRLNSPVLT